MIIIVINDFYDRGITLLHAYLFHCIELKINYYHKLSAFNIYVVRYSRDYERNYIK